MTNKTKSLKSNAELVKISSKLVVKPTKLGKSYFDLTPKQKIKMIDAAAKESNRQQLARLLESKKQDKGERVNPVDNIPMYEAGFVDGYNQALTYTQNLLRKFDLWVGGIPVTPHIVTTLSAADVWNKK